MGIKDQLIKIKENWLIIVLALVLIAVVFGGGNFIQNISLIQTESVLGFADNREGIESTYYPPPSGDFAPEIEDRKIVKTTRLSTEVKRNTFIDWGNKLKNIISSSESYILNENMNKYGTGRKSYYSGSYQIKVSVDEYDSVISQLKEIGEINSFSENTQDITGTHANLEIQLKAEKERLERYNKMFEEAKAIEEKIELSDRIFNQERTIKSLENSLESIEKRVTYSTVYFTMTEKRSEYYNIVFVKVSELIKNLVGSFNNLIILVFIIIPWIIAIIITRFLWKLLKKKKYL